jgi:hypothetical protein
MKIFLTEGGGNDEVYVLIRHFHTIHKLYIRQLHTPIDKSFTSETTALFGRKKLFLTISVRFFPNVPNFLPKIRNGCKKSLSEREPKRRGYLELSPMKRAFKELQNCLFSFFVSRTTQI